MSAKVGASPWQNRPVSGLPASMASMPVKPRAIQWAYQVRISASLKPISPVMYFSTRRLFKGCMSQPTAMAIARTRARATGSLGSKAGSGWVSSRYSRIAGDWTSTWPSSTSVGTCCSGLRAA